ncbi:hypothetical protein [Roseomonas indoligenes]|uniref:Uncharacterized protein n=1 Tax=Roseomonas indoligenes TaxID=2820811 RepID=A0A940N0T0_9PROT|nr:hypothetical protein [Pararoseomonas indoligenes]MBP0492217.1 hypothetical protein [Pararoseomonas indoligenes]
MTERREYFSRWQIEDLIRRELHVYMPGVEIEWAGNCSAVAVWTEEDERRVSASACSSNGCLDRLWCLQRETCKRTLDVSREPSP